MEWPSQQDYSEAVKTPGTAFDDPELRSGTAEPAIPDVPNPRDGRFATVYRINGSAKSWAARFFLHNSKDRQYRYECIESFLRTSRLEQMVDFFYLERGVSINDSWYPMLKMDWVAGEQLAAYIKRHLHEPQCLSMILYRFERLVDAMTEMGIAHGDLQPANILVVDDELRLVDYDDVYVPTMTGLESKESGHPNFQHPLRASYDFGPEMDRFSRWAIYNSIKCLSIDPSLWDATSSGDECLLFRHTDFIDPLNSPAFYALEAHRSPSIVLAGRQIRALLSLPPHKIPPLGADIPRLDAMDALPRLGKIDASHWSLLTGEDRERIYLLVGPAGDADKDSWLVRQLDGSSQHHPLSPYRDNSVGCLARFVKAATLIDPFYSATPSTYVLAKDAVIVLVPQRSPLSGSGALFMSVAAVYVSEAAYAAAASQPQGLVLKVERLLSTGSADPTQLVKHENGCVTES